MISIFFWNLLKKPQTADYIVRLAGQDSIDVFLFAESPEDLSPVLKGLNSLGREVYYEVGPRVPPGNFTTQEPRAGRAKVRVISRLDSRRIRHIFTNETRDLSILELKATDLPQILIAAVHMPSKGSSAMQQEAARSVASQIESNEKQARCHDTILIGDLNMSPWEPGMVMVSCFHGVMTKRLATKLSARKGRLFRKERYACFYNPMWGLFGDQVGPGASYYWDDSAPENHHWYMLDQVLLRPSLMNRPHTVQILDSDGRHSLLNAEGIASKEHLSDHLPILFTLDV